MSLSIIESFPVVAQKYEGGSILSEENIWQENGSKLNFDWYRSFVYVVVTFSWVEG